MAPFLQGHASHPDWRMALAMASAQIDAQQLRRAGTADGLAPTLGFVYLTDHFAPRAAGVLEALRDKWPTAAWAGAIGIGVSASGVEYFDEPALVLMLAALPQQHFQIFSGARPLNVIEPYTALVHADPGTLELAEMVDEMSQRTGSGYLFGGVASSRIGAPELPLQIADGLFGGGLSGVGFTRDVPIVSRVTQGCQPVGPVRRITDCERNVVLALDGEPALACLLSDLHADPAHPRAALPKLRNTLAGLSDDPARSARTGAFGPEVRVRHLIGIDPGRQAVVIADSVRPGMQLAFCQRDVEAARRDLVRICSEIREELEPDVLPLEAAMALRGAGADSAPAATARIAGALYVSCTGRGGPHFGAPSAELATLRHALGDVPLAGFFAAGEIANRHLYGYTGVLTVFHS
jgi:small ligand-binding sensory domain FIST